MEINFSKTNDTLKTVLRIEKIIGVTCDFEVPHFRRPEGVLRFERPDEASQLGVSKGIVKDTAANWCKKWEGKKKREREGIKETSEPVSSSGITDIASL